MGSFLKLVILIGNIWGLHPTNSIELTKPTKPMPFSCPLGEYLLQEARIQKMKTRYIATLKNVRDSIKIMQEYLEKLLSDDFNNELPSKIPYMSLILLNTFSEALAALKIDNRVEFKEIIKKASTCEDMINDQYNLEDLEEVAMILTQNNSVDSAGFILDVKTSRYINRMIHKTKLNGIKLRRYLKDIK